MMALRPQNRRRAAGGHRRTRPDGPPPVGAAAEQGQAAVRAGATTATERLVSGLGSNTWWRSVPKNRRRVAEPGARPPAHPARGHRRTRPEATGAPLSLI